MATLRQAALATGYTVLIILLYFLSGGSKGAFIYQGF
jgi:hypothetical protein